jgi:hypothetical protein
VNSQWHLVIPDSDPATLLYPTDLVAGLGTRRAPFLLCCHFDRMEKSFSLFRSGFLRENTILQDSSNVILKKPCEYKQNRIIWYILERSNE